MSFYIKLIILVLMTTPSFGILYFFTGMHIANDKFSLLIAALYMLFANIKIWLPSLNWSIILISVVLITSLLRSFDSFQVFQDQDISFLMWCVALPIYLSIFKEKYNENKKLIFILLLFHIFTYLLQFVLGAFSSISIESIYIANPFQTDYHFPEVCCGFFRYAGFFNESSQISIFFAIMYWYFKSEKWAPLLILLVLLTFSMTGYLMVVALLIRRIKGKSIIFMSLIFILIFFLYYDFFLAIFSAVGYRVELVINSFGGLEGEPRIAYFIENLNRIFNNPMLGVGASTADMNRWDIISVYVLPYGIIGGSLWIAMIAYYFVKFRIGLFYIIVLLTNATMLSYVNTIMLLVAFTTYLLRKESIEYKSI